MGDDPPFLPVGTDVSAKYKGAFCEAKIKKVVRNIKCKLTLKAGGGIVTVNDDVIKGTLRVGSTVEVKQDPKKDAMEAVITKIQDCSQYTVVFDDGDITTLRRSALCLKSGRHFNESETLDQLPLTHPEHFSTPVIAGRRGRRGRAQSEESEGESVTGSTSGRRAKAETEPHVGRVVLVEAGGGAERRRPAQPAFPALVSAPTPQINVKEDYLVRSFKDGRYYTVPKKEAREFRKGSAPLEWAGVEAALQYLNNGVLPPHWDRTLFNTSRNTSDDSSDDEPREEKDYFVAQLYKFMDDRGTPLNRNPTIGNKDIDLYRLFRVVQKLGGYNRVTNQNQWKTVADKMGFHPVTTSITNISKQAYKKFLFSFEEFYRKLGVTLVAHPRGGRTPPAGRSLIRDRDKQPPTSSSASTPTQRSKDKDSDKSETDKSDKSETDKSEKSEKAEKVKEKPRGSDEEDSADNQPLVTTTPKVEKEKEKEKEEKKEKEKEKEKEKSTTPSTGDEKPIVKPRSLSKNRSVPPIKTEPPEVKRTPKRRPLSSKSESASTSSSRTSRRPQVSTDSDSSGRASRCGLTKKLQSRRSQSANSASSGNTIASNSSKRPRKRKTTEPSTSEGITRAAVGNVKAQVGDKLKVYYGPTQLETKVTYEAKVIEISPEGMLRVHYTGWNTRYDEWIKPQRIALNVTQYESRNKKGNSNSRRIRAKRTEESSARSDSDSDSDSDEDVQRLSKKSEDKSGRKTPTRSKDAKSSDSSSSSKPRKRPVRTVSSNSSASPAKKPRPNITGRDYDLNEIRSELKGLHTVKQETEDTVKQEPMEKDPPSLVPAQTPTLPPEPPQPEKQPEDVYEFKEPEPFELELHDEKKKRTHRIFDDISPTKYTLSLSKSLSEEISEDPLRPRPSTLRSPSLSPFRDFGATRDTPGRQSPEDESKDLFSMDDDSFPGDGSSGPIFEGFTPAKNQETYSKKSKVSKLRELIDDSPDSPADDEQSSEDESDEIVIKEEVRQPTPVPPTIEQAKTPEKVTAKEEPAVTTKTPEPVKESKEKEVPVEPKVKPEPKEVISEKPKTSPPQQKTEPAPTNTVSSPIVIIVTEPKKEEAKKDEPPKPSYPSSTLINPIQEPKEAPKLKIEKKPDLEPVSQKFEPPSSPLVDTEEDKSEPDSPVRIDVLPEPPPGFLLQSEGPKIAEKLLKAINSAKRLSMSPPAVVEERSATPKKDTLKPKADDKASPVSFDAKPPAKLEPIKPTIKVDPIRKLKTPDVGESIFGEPSIMTDAKRDAADVKKVKPKEPTPPRLLSPLNILERRKSMAEMPLGGPGKNNKVLSDTIQKLSSQINQAAKPLPPFPTEDRSESSDSDDSDRRLIIDKLSIDEWSSCEPPRTTSITMSSLSASVATVGGVHAGKSPGEWSAGESLLMLENACKNERKHSASVVVAGSGRPALAAPGPVSEEDGSLSLLLCEESIPGSPAAPASPAPPPRALHMPFACAPPHHHSKQDRRGEGTSREPPNAVPAPIVNNEANVSASPGAVSHDRPADGSWARRHALLDNTPPTTPDSSLDMSPHRERRMSERDSPSDRKDDEDESRQNDSSAMDLDKPHGGRSRKASESSGAGASRRRRARRDTDEPHHATLKYNFYIDLDPSWDCLTRINVLTTRLSDLRKAYHSVKAELAAIDRRRKKLRRKEREAVKAAKAACS